MIEGFNCIYFIALHNCLDCYADLTRRLREAVFKIEISLLQGIRKLNCL